jgi:hypothetical protein
MTIIDDFVQSLQSSDESETDYKKVWEMLGVAKSEPGEMAKLLTAILRADPEFAEPVHAGADYLDNRRL